MANQDFWQVEPKVNLYDQKTNLFPIMIEGDGDVYRVSETYEPKIDKSTPHVIYMDGAYHILGIPEAGELTPFSLRLLKRFIVKHFVQSLKGADFDFKGPYVCFHKKFPHKDSFPGIFEIFDRAFEFRFMIRDEQLFLVIDPHVAIFMRASIASLHQKGIPLAKLDGFHASYITGDRRLDGYVLRTFWQKTNKEGDKRTLFCEVKNQRTHNTEIVDASTVTPESRPEVIQEFLDLLGINVRLVNLHQQLSFLHSSKPSRDRLDKTFRIVNFLINSIFPLEFSGFKVTVASEPMPVKGHGFLRGESLSEPQLLFDKNDMSKVETRVYWGLRNHGPYDKQKPEINTGLIAPKSKMPHLHNLVSDLNNGTSIMPGGMDQFFWSKIRCIKEILLDSEDESEYEEKCVDFVKALPQDKSIDVVIAYVPKTSEYFFNTPYYKVKTILASAGIPTQMVTQETLRNLKWAYLNLATAIYAKAGAIPWALQDYTIDFDIVMGMSISHAVSFFSRIGEQKKYMGYANIFDEYGRWMFFEGTAAKPFEKNQRISQIIYLLREALGKYRAQKGIMPHKIAVHYYKRFSNPEIDAIRNFLDSKLSDYGLALININDQHPLRLYDKSKEDGSFPRGGYVILSDDEFLLCSTGFTILSKKRIGTPKILHVTMRQYPDSFINVETVARQLLGLTKLNYATLTPIVREPASLLFSRTIAKLASAMSEQEWNGMVREEVYERIKDKMWFL